MGWFEQQRLSFIREAVHVYGYINRDHLIRKFDISVAQASKDLNKFLEYAPGYMEYNKNSKRYERTA